ncbi:MAG TPA: hypothetical protein VKB88_38025 [Bryobacteraceae bacterium]|nr:hypothetical protein [Bryobacteraceae bacterium]
MDGILHKTPLSPIQLEPTVPPELDRIIGKAMEKDRDFRYQAAGDLLADLKRLRRDTDSGRQVGSGFSPTVATTSGPRRSLWLAASLAGVLAAVAVTSRVSRPSGARPEPTEIQLTANPIENYLYSAAISGDGKQIAYSDATGLYLPRAFPSASVPLYRRALQLDPAQLSATVGMGGIQMQRGQFSDAIRLWRDALDRNSGLELVRCNLAVAQWKTGQGLSVGHALRCVGFDSGSGFFTDCAIW